MDTLLLLHQGDLASVMDKVHIITFRFTSGCYISLCPPVHTGTLLLSLWNTLFLGSLAFKVRWDSPPSKLLTSCAIWSPNCGPTLLNRPHIPTLWCGLWNHSPPGLLSHHPAFSAAFPAPHRHLHSHMYYLNSSWLEFPALLLIILLEEWKHLQAKELLQVVINTHTYTHVYT